MAEAKHVRGAPERPTTNDLGCRWYVAFGGATEGPVGYDALLARARAGELGSLHHVWRPGFEAWIPVSARPDLVAAAPARPTLGLVPATLEEAQAQATEELFFSQDVVAVADDGAPQMIYAGATSTEDLALEALELGRREPPPPPQTGDLAAVPTLPSYEAQEETSSAIERVALLMEGAPRSTPPPGATDLDEEDLAKVLGRRRAWALLLLLVVVIAGLALALVLAGPRLGFSLVPTAAPEGSGSVDGSAPHFPRLSRPRSALFTSRSAGAEAQAEMEAEVEDAPKRKRSAKPAPKENLAWLNREGSASADPEPEPERPAPRRFRVEAPEAEVRIETPVAVPTELSDAAVGPVISASLGRLARCGRLDRVRLEVPAGTAMRLRVRSDGTVARVKASGAPGAVASCLTRAARRLHFPAFQKSEAQVEIRFARAGTVRAEVQSP